MTFLLLALFIIMPHSLPAVESLQHKSPNIIFILADDLGYGDLGCYGQELIKTPRLDQMSKEGMRFTQYYAGATVCAPSRCTLMTGLHNGHAYVRGNSNGWKADNKTESMSIQSLRPEDVTLAEILKIKGYSTALIGKWGLGESGGGEQGLPWKQGFDKFFGYLSQLHAHNYFPKTLWDQDKQITLKNEVHIIHEGPWGEAGYGTKRVEYSHDLIMQQAKSFIKAQASGDKPFFLYLASTLPHANNEGTKATGNGQDIPDYGIYKNENWPDPDKGQAAMISYLDQGVGEVLDLLKELKIDEETLVIFTSDNGPHKEGGNNPELFKPAGILRGMKRDLYEGGIRVPLILRWPGKISAEKISHHICYAGDFFATFCELADAEKPAGLDSISILPELTGKGKQQLHDYLYWEFYEQGSRQAVRQGDWKCIRQPMLTGKVELFDLTSDIHEETNVAEDNPDIVKKMITLMDEAHVDNPNWKIPSPVKNKAKN